MKSMFVTLMIAFFSVTTYAQSSAGVNTLMNDTVDVQAAPADRIAKLENDVKELKASNEQLQKQMAELKQQLQVKKKKLSVSRTGSKQPVWINE